MTPARAAGLVGLTLLLSGCAGQASPPPTTHATRHPRTSTARATTGVPPVATPSTPAVLPSTPPDPGPSAAPAGSALAALRALPVRAAGPQVPDERPLFGPPYADTNRDGCDTRNQALQRDLHDVVTRPGSHGCAVLSGVLTDAYTGRTIAYRRGRHSPIDFEHVVALEDAARTGAMGWTAQRREDFANDPLNVLMVGASANRAKGEDDASLWLPPATAYRCGYVARQVAVKAAYGLWVTPTERDAITRVLATCPGQALPTRAQVAFPPLDRSR